MQNRLTIKDIARLSGVGKSTVSRVLNNESGVSQRTRERVEAVMNQHGFSPSRSARAMRGQSDKVVAIIVTRLDSLSENLAVQTMLPAFYEQGYDPIMMESQFSPQLVAEHLGVLKRRNIDGVVLFGFTGITEEMLAHWQSSLVLLALGVIETRLKRIVPDYLYLVVVPVCSLILAVFLAHALIGPFGRMIGDGVAFAVRHLMTGSFAPIGAALFGFLYAPLVITGVHQTTLAIDLQMIQSMGGTPVWPLIALSNIAQGSAVIGIIISSRKHNEREISVPAAISAWLGVTEPAMYGINLKYRFPMLCAMIGSGLAGLLCGLNGVMANGIGVGGLPGILSIQPSYWQVFALAMAIAIIIPIVLTSFIYQRKYRLGTLDIV